MSGVRGLLPRRLRRGGYGATWGGAVAGEILGGLLATILAVVAYQVAGGAGCEDDACDEPFGVAVLVFIVGGMLGLMVGGALGCYVALREIGDSVGG